MEDDAVRTELIERCKKSMFVTVTEEMLLAGQSSNGGWSQSQLYLIGVSWPPDAGWKDRIRGQRWAGSKIASFIELRDAHLETGDARGRMDRA